MTSKRRRVEDVREASNLRVQHARANLVLAESAFRDAKQNLAHALAENANIAAAALTREEEVELQEFFTAFRDRWYDSDRHDEYYQDTGDGASFLDYTQVSIDTYANDVPFVDTLRGLCQYNSHALHQAFESDDNAIEPSVRICELLRDASMTFVLQDTTYFYRDGDKKWTEGKRRVFGM